MSLSQQLTQVSSWMLLPVAILTGIYLLFFIRHTRGIWILAIYSLLLSSSLFLSGYEFLLPKNNASQAYGLVNTFLLLLASAGYFAIVCHYAEILTKAWSGNDGKSTSSANNTFIKSFRIFSYVFLVIPIIIVTLDGTFQTHFIFIGTGLNLFAYYTIFLTPLVFSSGILIWIFLQDKFLIGLKSHLRLFFIGAVFAILISSIEIALGKDRAFQILIMSGLGYAAIVGGMYIEDQIAPPRKGVFLSKLVMILVITVVPLLTGVYVFSINQIAFGLTGGDRAGLLKLILSLYADTAGYFILVLIVLILVAFLLYRRILNPLTNLINSADEHLMEDPNFQFPVNSRDEIGLFANKLNNFIYTKRQSLEGFEENLASQSKLLERRQKYINTFEQAARISVVLRDLRQYLNEFAISLTNGLSYYHAAIFLMDDTGDHTILQASNSEGGLVLLSRGYKLEMSHQSIIGLVGLTGRARIVHDFEFETEIKRTDELPRTRSEIAIPLKVIGKVIGVLDVQSLQANAFSAEDQTVLNVLADLVALTIHNFMSLNESNQALQELEKFHSRDTVRNWRDRLSQQSLAYRYDRLSVVAEASNEPVRSLNPMQPGFQLDIPITLRGQNFGSLVLRRDESQPNWTEEDLTLAVDAVSQIMPALENARLLHEIKQQAQIESILGQVSAKIQGSKNVENLMRITVEELGKVIAVNRLRFRLMEQAVQEEEP